MEKVTLKELQNLLSEIDKKDRWKIKSILKGMLIEQDRKIKDR